MPESTDLIVHVESRGAATVLRPDGDVDLSRAPSLRTALAEAIDARPGKLVVDLTDVPYMDSSGVATFVEAMQLCRKDGTTLVLCALQERVTSIFEIARLDMVFTIVKDLDAALEA